MYSLYDSCLWDFYLDLSFDYIVWYFTLSSVFCSSFEVACYKVDGNNILNAIVCSKFEHDHNSPRKIR